MEGAKGLSALCIDDLLSASNASVRKELCIVGAIDNPEYRPRLGAG
jgi:hypothetical protein